MIGEFEGFVLRAEKIHQNMTYWDDVPKRIRKVFPDLERFIDASEGEPGKIIVRMWSFKDLHGKNHTWREITFTNAWNEDWGIVYEGDEYIFDFKNSKGWNMEENPDATPESVRMYQDFLLGKEWKDDKDDVNSAVMWAVQRHYSNRDLYEESRLERQMKSRLECHGSDSNSDYAEAAEGAEAEGAEAEAEGETECEAEDEDEGED